MKKNKLVLDRETITSLQSDALAGVAGGNAAGCIEPPTRMLCSGGGGLSSALVGCGGASNISRISGISRQISIGGK
jgi:hypothetical protein